MAPSAVTAISPGMTTKNESPRTRRLMIDLVERGVGPPVRDDARGVADDVAGHPDATRLAVFVVHAGVADVRCRLQDDLTCIRGIGERLLVAGHAGGEDDLAEGGASRAVCTARVACSVFEDEDGGFGEGCHDVAPVSGAAVSSVAGTRRCSSEMKFWGSPSVRRRYESTIDRMRRGGWRRTSARPPRAP